MEELQLFLTRYFGISLSGTDVKLVYIKKFQNEDSLEFLREVKKPYQWKQFSEAFFNSLRPHKTLCLNSSKCGVRLCSSINLCMFDFWEELYEYVGEKFFKFTFNCNKLFYKVNNTFVCLTCMPLRVSKPNYQLSSLSKSLLEQNDHLGNYGQSGILKSKLLYHFTHKKWPKNSVFNRQDVSVEKLLNDICGITSSNYSGNFHLKEYMKNFPGIVCGLTKLIKIQKKHHYIKTYEKLNFDSVAGPINCNRLLLFVKNVILNYLPEELVGSRVYLLRLSKCFKLIMKRNINQVTTIGEIAKYMYAGEKNQSVIYQARLIYWLIHEYIFKILVMFFYFNLSPKSEIIAYTGRYWSNREQRMIKSLIRRKKLAPSKNDNLSSDNIVRFLPKSDGITFRLLVHHKNKIKKELNYTVGVFVRQLTAKMKQEAGIEQQNLHYLWSKFHSSCPSNTKLYYMKSDIRDAYGSIKPEILMNIIDKELNKIDEKLFELLKFNFNDAMFRKTVSQFNCLPITLPSGVAYEDPEFSETISKSHLREVIWDHLNSVEFHLKYHKGLYTMIEGLPQGGQLSSVLCDLYFTALDIEYLIEFSKNDFFIRLVDDYLFVSTSYERAKRFVQLMNSGFPSYNVQIEGTKSITNVDTEDLYHVPFYGHLINTKSHSIEVYAPYLINRRILSTMSFTKVNLELLATRMKNTSSLKLKPAFLNLFYNTEGALLCNLMFSSYLMALKFKALVELISGQYYVPVSYMIHCAETAIFYISKNAVKASNGLSFLCVKYIALRCFITVLNRNYEYDAVVKSLSLQASRLSKKFSVGGNRFNFKFNKYIPSILCNLD